MVTTVQPDSGRNAEPVGTLRMTVGAGRTAVVSVGFSVGVAWFCGRQPTRLTVNRSSKSSNVLFIYISTDKVPAILPVKA